MNIIYYCEFSEESRSPPSGSAHGSCYSVGVCVFLSFPCNAMSLSMVFDCHISWSYSLRFGRFNLFDQLIRLAKVYICDVANPAIVISRPQET